MTNLRNGYFPMYVKQNDKSSMEEFLRGALQHSENVYKFSPKVIYLNIADIGFLGGNRGVTYRSKNIPVNVRKNCLVKHTMFE